MSEIIVTKPASVPKTLPMKHKCLMYGAIALWESLKAKGVVCESNFMDVVNLDVGEQIKFLDNMIDVNYLEKEVVKPLQKARKKELADAKKPVKEKKVRAPRAKKADATATATEPPSVIQTPVSYDKATEELVQELSYEPVVVVPEKEEKKKKPKIRKPTEEKVPKEKVPKEKVPKEKVPKEKKPKKKEEEVVKKVEEPQDYWMIFHNNERYWTTDENQKNGELFENTTDEDGDFGPGRLVGKIENGVIVLN
jgi:hypothetical protein